MKFCRLFTLLICFCFIQEFSAYGQFDGLWIPCDYESACYFKNDIMYWQNLDNQPFMSANRIRLLRKNKLKIGDPEYYFIVEENKPKKWHKGKYVFKNDTIQFFFTEDTLCLVKSKHRFALDHNLNSFGLKIDLPFAESIRYPDLSSSLRIKIYVGFDPMNREKIMMDGEGIKDRNDFLAILKKYKDQYDDYPFESISVIIYCDKKVSMKKIYFLEKILLEQDIRKVVYATKFEGMHPLLLDLVGITLTLNPNVLVEAED